MNTILRWLGVLVYYVGLSRLLRWLNRDVPRVLAYHACEGTESPFIHELRCNTPPNVLRGQLDYLAEKYNVISVGRLETGEFPPRSVAITFDDGYRSVYDNAFPLLREREMPATVYLVTSTSHGARLIWVNELNWFLHTQPAAAAFTAESVGLPRGASASTIVAHVQAHEPPSRIEALLVDLARRFGVDRVTLARDARLYLSPSEIREMGRTRFSFGNHTYSHPNLTLLTGAECRQEIEGGARISVELPDSPVEVRASLAYPFGIHNDAVRRMAVELGNVSVMGIGGWNRPLDLSQVCRVSVYATTRAQFFAELEVVYPVKAWMRRLIASLLPRGSRLYRVAFPGT